MAATPGEVGGHGMPAAAAVASATKSMSEDDNNNRERTLLQFESTKLPLEEFIKEWNARIQRRSEFLEKNLSIKYEEFEKLVKGKKLDSNLKKCTAFVRKMRQFQDSYRPALESDIRALNLTKYISEIALVIVELRLKPTELSSLVSVCSEIHTRYSDFSKQLLKNFGNILAVTELGANAKLSTDLRLFTELFLAGILPQSEATSLLFKTIHNLVSLDKDASQLIPTLVVLLRDLTEELIGVIPRDIRVALEDHICESQLNRQTNLGLKTDDKAKLKGIFKKYFHLIKAVFSKKNDKVWGSAKYIRKLIETKGEVPPERQRCHDELAAELEKYYCLVGKLANLLDVQTPKIRRLSSNPDEEFEQALMNAADDGEGPVEGGEALFEDEETRQFYQDLPDLVAYMFEKKNGLLKPASSRDAFDQSLKDPNPNDATAEPGKEDDETEEEGDTSNDNHSESSEDLGDLDSDLEESDSDFRDFDAEMEKAELMIEIEDEDIPQDLDGDVLPSLRDDGDAISGRNSHEDIPVAPGHSKLNFIKYLDNLKNCVNRQMIDKAAFEFVGNFRSKKCRMELAKQLFSIPRQRMDLLRLFSRLCATVSKIYPDIGQEICDLLRRDFRFLVLKRDQQRLESKLRVTRFIAELTIFSVFSKSEAFNCLKMLLRNFTHHQIEMTCCFLETCGRYLYRSKDSHRRMKLYLEEMLRRKISQFLEPCYAYKVDCAYNQVCPPRGGPPPRKVKSPLHAFMSYVLVFDLNRDTLERANKALRMFDWNDPAKSAMVIGILSSPWRLNYSQLDTAAALLASLKKIRPTVTQAVIENISESIRLGCEFESEDINNMRMSTCQYFAHLYTYKAVTTTSLLNVMYYLISYGVTYKSNVFSTMDPPDSLYRIRVVCFMLRIIGEFVTTPKSNKRLDFFLKYFQRYFLYKRGLPVWEESCGRKRFPHYVEEMFEDTIRKVRDTWTFVKTVEEAEEDILELDKKLREKVCNDKVKRAISGERNAVGVKVPVKKECEVIKAPPPPAPVNYAVATGRNYSQRKQEETAKVPLETLEEELENEEDDDDDFEKEFRAMLSDSMSVSSTEKIPGSSGGIGGPATYHRKPVDVPAAKVVGSGESGLNALNYGLPKVKVTVLTKQNNKLKEKTLEIETKEEFLVSIKEREEKEKKELQEVKTRTLQLSQRQQEEEQNENDKSMMQALWKLGKVAITSSGQGGGRGGASANQNNKRGNQFINK